MDNSWVRREEMQVDAKVPQYVGARAHYSIEGGAMLLLVTSSYRDW